MKRRPASEPRTIRATKFGTILTASTLVAVTILAAFGGPATGGPTPLNTDVLAFSEDFEGNPTARGWVVADENGYNGTDTWSNTTYRSASGNGSAWSAAAGDHSGRQTLFADGFEAWNYSDSVWTFEDRNSTGSQGLDYWGQTSYRFMSGSYSLWNAQVGTNLQLSNQANSAVHMYDNDMNATALIDIDFSGYSDPQISFSYWTNNENSWDGLYTAFFDGSWHYENAKNGNSGGWKTSTYNIPTSATRIGFMFTSDGSVIYEGSYVDDVKITGTRSDLNRDLKLYDDGASATMFHAVDLSGFVSGRMDYRFWIDSQAPVDVLEVMYSDGLSWTYADPHSGNSNGWGGSSVILPITTVTVGFRFSTDTALQREGAYIDDVKVWGVVEPLTCSATAYEVIGMEVVSAFHFGGSASGGLRPYIFAWSFGDDTTSSLQSPSHFYREVGEYSPTMSVRDQLGQTCSAATAPAILRVTHDTSHVYVSPTRADVIEGGSITLYGRDGQSHPYALEWETFPPECGSLSSATGTSVLFTAADDAGGASCTVTGSYGSAAAVVKLTVLQDTHIIHVSPLGGEVVEGKGLRLTATDAHGGELAFAWTTTCGRVQYGPASFTFFEAVTEGGVTCTITASYGADSASVDLDIVHDTSTILVSPTSATIVEGTSESFSALDVYHHPFLAAWTVEPSTCGEFSIVSGASTTFAASPDAGGMSCTISARSGTNHEEIPVTVTHDTGEATLSPPQAEAAQGGTLMFTFGDRYGHPLSATWSISPSSCGSLLPPSGITTTLTVAPDAGGLTCTVGGTALGMSKFAGVTVLYGAPSSVVVTAGASDVIAGASVPLNVVVKDNVGHTIPGLQAQWSTDCGEVSPTTGVSTILSAPATAAGTNCTVTASYLSISGSASVHVQHAGPFTILVTPPAPEVSGGGTQQFQATVLDRFGQPVTDAPVYWKATCGELSSSMGLTVTYTAPNGFGGESCKVTASLEVGGAVYESAGSVKTGLSTMILLGFAAAGAAVAGLVVMRMRSRGRADKAVHALEAAPAASSSLDQLEATAPGVPEPGPGGSLPYTPAGMITAPTDTPAESSTVAASVCPNCGAHTEVGWTACPECGKDFGAF